MNKKLKSGNGIGVLENSDGSNVTNDRDKANLLNNYFASVCKGQDHSEPSVRLDKITNSNIDNVVFDIHGILVAAKKIKSKSKTTPDPDGYPVILLTKLINVLCEPLSLIFNSFMSIVKLPTAWKAAIVAPFFKK